MKEQYKFLSGQFEERFHSKPLLIQAPGRINLLGEHTDYNDGFVMPAAIDLAMIFAMNRNDDQLFRFFSLDYDQYFETADLVLPPNNRHWARYLMGVLAQFEKAGVELQGIDCMFGGNIPIGSGLSSSAAIECGFAFGLNNLFNAGISTYELALMAQKAEHEYAGVMCGIMDQYACLFGKKDHFLRLDCRTYEHEYIPFHMSQCVIVLVDTRVKHSLALSEYNQRRNECQAGADYMQKNAPSVKALRDVSPVMVESAREGLGPVVYKRCKYIAEENERVLLANQALHDKDPIRLGELMYQTHNGLQHEFEVSCKELDILVDITRKMDYVYGARMMGGGFGGCTLNLVLEDKMDLFTGEISKSYARRTGKEPGIYKVSVCDGVKTIIS